MKCLKTIGKQGEVIAWQYLAKRGYQIVTTNFQTRFGELDIICQKDQTLIFVEVKTRTSFMLGWPEEAVSPKKLGHLLKAMAEFQSRQAIERPVRFDVMAVVILPGQKAKVKHWINLTQDFEVNPE